MNRLHCARHSFVYTTLIALWIFPASAEDNKETVGNRTSVVTQNVEKISALRDLLGIPKNWTRRSTYDSQVTVGSAVRSGNVVTRDRNQAAGPMKYVLFEPASFNGSAVLWIDGAGITRFCEPGRRPDDVQPILIVNQLLDAGFAVISVDLPAAAPLNDSSAKADSSLSAVRIRATLSAVAAVLPHVTQLHIVGTGDAGPVTLMAAPFLGDLSDAERQRIQAVIGDISAAISGQETSTAVRTEFPGASDFGGVAGIVSLGRKVSRTVAGTQNLSATELQQLQDSVRDSGTPEPIKLIRESLTDQKVVDLVTQKSP